MVHINQAKIMENQVVSVQVVQEVQEVQEVHVVQGVQAVHVVQVVQAVQVAQAVHSQHKDKHNSAYPYKHKLNTLERHTQTNQLIHNLMQFHKETSQ
jgi:outer membrane phospholipase A